MLFARRPAASAAALLVALGTAQAASAAVTAQQVWDEWKANMDMSMITVGAESYAGGVLTVTDLAFNSTDEDGTTVSATVPQVTLTEGPDGTVAVALPETVPVMISSPADAEMGSPASDVTVNVVQTGASLTVSGDPGALSYAQTASRIAIELDSIMQDGSQVPGEATFALNDVSGTTTSGSGDLRDMTYDFAAGSVDILVDVTNPEDQSHFALSGQVADLALNADMAIPASMATSPDTAIMDGLAGTGGYTTGAGQYTFEFTDATGPTNGQIATGGSTVSFQVGQDAVGYDVLAQGLTVALSGASMPFPINASIAEYGLNLLVPAQPTDAPAPWKVGVNLTDLAVNDEVWSLIDPQAMLDHGPATLIAQLSGTATMTTNLFDPAQQEAMETAGTPPGQLDSLSIDDLNLSIAGAQVTGTGSFTVDNATMSPMGLPTTVGSADLQLSGVNGLIDNLVAMGLVPQDQVMGARMFLGLLAVPVDGQADVLSSHIETTADGQILANGQRLQ